MCGGPFSGCGAIRGPRRFTIAEYGPTAADGQLAVRGLLRKTAGIAGGFLLQKSKAAQSGGFAAGCGSLAQVEERLHASSTQSPFRSQRPAGHFSLHSLASPLQTEPAAAGLRFGCRLRRPECALNCPVCAAGLRSWATGKAKPPSRAALQQDAEAQRRLKNAFMPGYSAMPPSSQCVPGTHWGP